MTSVIRHLHAAVKETEPTFDEWMMAIEFLTRTGQICNEWRQEYILLSDTLGVSMLVDAINNRKPNGATEIDGARPVPRLRRAALPSTAPTSASTARASRSGCAAASPTPRGAASPAPMLDVWQTNDDGFYDVQQKGVQPDMNLRGQFTTAPTAPTGSAR